jgi:phosphoribosylamine--glycine ligase
MRALVVGNGAREHALAWKLAAGASVQTVWIAPGNAGTAEVGRNLPEVAATDGDALSEAARKNAIDLAVIGPDDALAAGVADCLRAAGLAVVGPSATDARLETSKAFCKSFLLRHGIPTARATELHNPTELQAYLRSRSGTVVLKMDGLAQGKGVLVSNDQDALQRFGRAALARGTLLGEEYLRGYELSLFLLLDGTRAVALPPCSDFKRAGPGDTGPNTGGMGAICPVPRVDATLAARIEREITQPTVRGLQQEGLLYRGVLYIGLMITRQGPRVLEFNVRLGDPETQVLMPLLTTDLGELMQAVATGTLSRVEATCSKRSALTVVVAAAGYPGSYRKGLPVESLPPAADPRGVLFHATTARSGGTLRTGGGRSFAVTGLGDDLATAHANAYELVRQVRFPGAWWRPDIGTRFLTATPAAAT